jgi:hypothetical protein
MLVISERGVFSPKLFSLTVTIIVPKVEVKLTTKTR